MIHLSGICAAIQAADEERGIRSMADAAGMARSTYHAAELCGIDPATLWRWTNDDASVAACLFRRGWYRVEALAALGLTKKPMAEILADIQRQEAAA